MSVALRVLIIEDNVSDAALLERHLRRGGFDVCMTRVDCAAELERALRTSTYDVVISDYHLPGFDALTALAMVRRCGELPFIVVSGLIGEDRAVELMRAGANDYVMKDHLARLLPAIERELAESARHREQQRLDASLRTHEEMFQLALNATGDGAWDWSPQTGAVLLSHEFARMLGYEPGELKPHMDEWRERVHPDDLPRVVSEEQSHYSGASPQYRSEHRIRTRSGDWIWVLDRGVVIERNELGLPTREVGTTTDITRAKATEEALRKSHETLQKLSRQVPGMLYQFQLHPDGRMTMPFVSDGLRALFDYDRDDIGEDAAPVMGRVHQDEQQRLADSIRHSAATLTTWIGEYRVTTPSNGTRWMHGEAQPELLPDGSVLWHGLIRDITEQRAAQERLRLFHACIHHVNDAVLVTEAEPIAGPGPRIVYVNPAFEQQTGYLLAEVIGKTPRILQGPETDTATLWQMRQLLDQWQPMRVELLNYRKSGEAFWVELEIAPVTGANGWYTHWVSVQRDISARKLADSEREHLIRELEARNQDLDAYSHSVAHDLRNPVISIRGLADLATIALNSDDRARVRNCLDRIARSATRADTLIRNLMNLARVGNRAIRLSEFPVAEALASTLSDLELLIARSGAEVSLEVDESLLIQSDDALFRVMTTNLIDNAITHRHPERKPLVRISGARLTDTPGIELRIEDNGIGIESDAQSRVFGLFERVGDESHGTGIGLALVVRAAKLLGGSVSLAHSTPGVGSCFVLRLPSTLPTHSPQRQIADL